MRGPAVVWRYGTVTALIDESPHAKTIELQVPDWPGHAAGQHVDVRLTADDAYQAQRSYSIASAPEDPRVALTGQSDERYRLRFEPARIQAIG